MRYKEHIWKPISPVDFDCVYCQCISADLIPQKGLLFDNMDKMEAENPDYLNEWDKMDHKGDCLYDAEKGIMDLVVKTNVYESAEESIVKESLVVLKNLCRWHQIKSIYLSGARDAFYRIKWTKIRKMIKETFADLNIDIFVVRRTNFKNQYEILKHISERTW